MDEFISKYREEYSTIWKKESENFPPIDEEIKQLLNINPLCSELTMYGYLLNNVEEDETYADNNANEVIAKLAACVELIYAACIITDDVIDDDKKRRNKDTVHVQLRKMNRSEQSDQHVHIHETYIYVMALLSRAISLLSEVMIGYQNGETKRISGIANRIASIINDISVGYYTELESLSISANQDVVNDIIEKERIQLISNSIAIGYMCNPKTCDQDTQLILEEIGKEFGIIIQLLNDAQPFVNTSEYKRQKGKERLLFNRKNYVVSLIYNSASPEQQKDMDTYRNDKNGLDKAKQLFVKLEIKSKLKHEIFQRRERINELLEKPQIAQNAIWVGAIKKLMNTTYSKKSVAKLS